MAGKKKPHKDYEIVEGHDVIVDYDDKGKFGMTTDEDRSGQGPRDRRKTDRRKADEKTDLTRRMLGDRRNQFKHTYLKPTNPPTNDPTLFTGSGQADYKLGARQNALLNNDAIEEIQAIRKEREIARRGGELRAKIKSRKGGLLGLGFIVGNAFNAGMDAYNKNQNKQ